MHRPFFTSKYGFSSGVVYVMRPILLIMWRAFQSFILKVLAYENRSDPCGYWCAWYSEEGYGRKHQESIREMLGSARILRKVLSV